MDTAAKIAPVLPARHPVYRHRFTHSAQTIPAPANGLMTAQSMKIKTRKKEKGTPNSTG
jgi:hypothetical protein